ncbi:type II toxin-antitoxin system RelE/ParE family toxin [Christiangramia sp. LLG6405-1]|uniref:type II toxin-antitoxin system RelE/ParE family toxin n=1 Tax=Christiangramia sp. LLG6405-1 TaxID=3160832 RepID=UPI003868484E
MAKYYLTKKAVADLTNIWDYTLEKWSEQQADYYYQNLIESFEELTEKPLLGKNYEGITAGLLGLRVKKHIIFYREISKDEIEITRILHGSMDLETRIRE